MRGEGFGDHTAALVNTDDDGRFGGRFHQAAVSGCTVRESRIWFAMLRR
jgi:hypothetical protein